jgi:hypothetical protein
LGRRRGVVFVELAAVMEFQLNVGESFRPAIFGVRVRVECILRTPPQYFGFVEGIKRMGENHLMPLLGGLQIRCSFLAPCQPLMFSC